jgi:hypothetical protein
VYGIYGLVTSPEAFNDPVSGWSPHFERALAVSVGYFIFDILLMLVRYPDVFKGSGAMVAHHSVCIYIITYCMNYRVGIMYGLVALMTEVTTVFYNIRYVDCLVDILFTLEI